MLREPRRLTRLTRLRRYRRSSIGSTAILLAVTMVALVVGVWLVQSWDTMLSDGVLFITRRGLLVVGWLHLLAFGPVTLKGLYVLFMALDVISPLYRTASNRIGSLPALLIGGGVELGPGAYTVTSESQPRYRPGPMGPNQWLWTVRSPQGTVRVLSAVPFADVRKDFFEAALADIGVTVSRRRSAS